MEPYDIGMIVVLIGATLFGFYKGLAWQIASLASIIISYVVALKFRDTLAPHFGSDPHWNVFASMLALYAVTSLVIWLLFRYVSDFINRVRLKEFDRQLGAIFGLAKGVLLCVTITFFAVTLSPSAREHVLVSRSGYYIAQFIHKADAIMPKEAHDVLGPYLHKLDESLEPATHQQPSTSPFTSPADHHSVPSPAPQPVPYDWKQGRPIPEPAFPPNPGRLSEGQGSDTEGARPARTGDLFRIDSKRRKTFVPIELPAILEDRSPHA